MTASPPAASGGIFISYRRAETAYPAGWLFDRLTEEFGEGQIFKDVDSIELGDDFVDVIRAAVASTDVLLALIGDQWLTITDDEGRRRLDDPEDFVRLEIEAALARDVRVIPILVEGASMPDEEELPPTLAPLARRQALDLSPSRFDFDTGRLVSVLRRTLADVQAAKADTVPAGEPARTTDEETQVRTDDGAPARPSPAGHPPPRSWRDRLTERPRLLLGAGIGSVALVAVLAAVIATSSSSPDASERNDGVGTPPTTAEEGATTTVEEVAPTALPFEDDFSTRERGWSGGRYGDGVYRIEAERTDEAYGVLAAPGDVPTVGKVDLEVETRRVGGSASDEYGYGLFCMGRGPDDLYAFVLRTLHARIEKRSADGGYEELASDSAITAPADGDPGTTLRATCTHVRSEEAVDLRFWVGGELILEARDADAPHTRGTFGLQVLLNRNGGAPGETLEIEFDDFRAART
ncbi:MAG TPA: toll/interleukin-1 receptor domain-containing protein [Actinomycetota bacterium]|nr:toll/interleukin-1 receptor domain-containing protein [Actinomycetota bacterium]